LSRSDRRWGPRSKKEADQDRELHSRKFEVEPAVREDTRLLRKKRRAPSLPVRFVV